MRTLAAGGAALSLPHVASRAEAPDERRSPNIVLIITDDQGYGDLGCHGNDTIRTPHTDALASQSVELTQFYVCPVCAPTRAALMTGRYCYRTGVWETYRGGEAMRLDEVTVAEVLRDAGYQTGIFGKWHLGDIYPWVPSEQGFTDGLYFRHGNWPYYEVPIERDNKPVANPGYLTDVFTDAAMEFIETNRDRPFFCYLPYNAPHAPLEMPQRYLDMYEGLGLDEHTHKCYGMITGIDDNVGRLLQRIDELQLADNTIVIFLTDNGPQWDRYNCGLRAQKGSVYDGGIRVPFFARWPGHFPAGAKVEQIGANIDLMPTLLGACGVPLPDGPEIDGTSLLPLLTGAAGDWADRTLFFHWQRSMEPKPYPNGAARTQQYKLVNGNELYDMNADPGETTNIADQHPDIVERLSQAYDEWWEDVASERGFVRPPTPVGYAAENPAHLLAMHAWPAGEIEYQYGGLLNDRLTNWTRVEDSVYWELEVVAGGTYEASLLYRCPAADAGSRVRVSVGEQSVEATIDAAQKAGREWETRAVGTLRLEAGETRLVVQPLSQAGTTVMELHEVRLKRVE